MKRAPADEVVTLVAGPREEGLVDLDDRAVGVGRQVAAGRALVQRLGVVGEERVVERLEGLTADRSLGAGQAPTNASIAAVVASGALRFGQ